MRPDASGATHTRLTTWATLAMASEDDLPHAVPPPPDQPPTPAHKACSTFLDRALNRSPFVKFMLKALEVRWGHRLLRRGLMNAWRRTRAAACERSILCACRAPSRPMGALIPTVRSPRGIPAALFADMRAAVGIVLCENYIVMQKEANDVVTHELVHAFDHCRAKIDWTNCRHHACSEVRACSRLIAAAS